MSVLRNLKDLSKKIPTERSPINQTDSLIYKFGPFCLNEREHLLLRNGKRVGLRPTAFKVLRILIENQGCLVEKDRLMAEVWPESFVEQANLTNNIAALRKALGEGPHTKRYIETVPVLGYRFVAAVEEIEETKSRPTAGRSRRDNDQSRAPITVAQSHSRVPSELGGKSEEGGLSLIGGLRIVARKTAKATEVVMILPRAAPEEPRTSRPSFSESTWNLQTEDMTISCLSLANVNCIKLVLGEAPDPITFKDAGSSGPEGICNTELGETTKYDTNPFETGT